MTNFKVRTLALSLFVIVIIIGTSILLSLAKNRSVKGGVYE